MLRRNRFVAFALLPAAVMLWVVGWSLFWVGSRSKGVDIRKPLILKAKDAKLSVAVLARLNN